MAKKKKLKKKKYFTPGGELPVGDVDSATETFEQVKAKADAAAALKKAKLDEGMSVGGAAAGMAAPIVQEAFGDDDETTANAGDLGAAALKGASAGAALGAGGAAVGAAVGMAGAAIKAKKAKAAAAKAQKEASVQKRAARKSAEKGEKLAERQAKIAEFQASQAATQGGASRKYGGKVSKAISYKYGGRKKKS